MKFTDYDEQQTLALDFDPKAYHSPKDAATALHGALVLLMQNHYPDQKPEIECSLWTPAEAAERGYDPQYMVSWEAGPSDWGIMLSERCHNMPGSWFTEPHYSFDLCFVDERSAADKVREFGEVAAKAMRDTAGCPKCAATSGGDWSQCGGLCPMPMSPHHAAWKAEQAANAEAEAAAQTARREAEGDT